MRHPPSTLLLPSLMAPNKHLTCTTHNNNTTMHLMSLSRIHKIAEAILSPRTASQTPKGCLLSSISPPHPLRKTSPSSCNLNSNKMCRQILPRINKMRQLMGPLQRRWSLISARRRCWRLTKRRFLICLPKTTTPRTRTHTSAEPLATSLRLNLLIAPVAREAPIRNPRHLNARTNTRGVPIPLHHTRPHLNTCTHLHPHHIALSLQGLRRVWCTPTPSLPWPPPSETRFVFFFRFLFLFSFFVSRSYIFLILFYYQEIEEDKNVRSICWVKESGAATPERTIVTLHPLDEHYSLIKVARVAANIITSWMTMRWRSVV